MAFTRQRENSVIIEFPLVLWLSSALEPEPRCFAEGLSKRMLFSRLEREVERAV